MFEHMPILQTTREQRVYFRKEKKNFKKYKKNHICAKCLYILENCDCGGAGAQNVTNC